MRILYVSDDHNWDNWGMKRSLDTALVNHRKVDRCVGLANRKLSRVLDRAHVIEADQVWLLDTAASLDQATFEALDQRGSKVVRFSFDDGQDVIPERMANCHAYVTNSLRVHRELQTDPSAMIDHYMPPAVDLERYKPSMNKRRRPGITVLGERRPSYLADLDFRVKAVHSLREAGFRVHCWGIDWENDDHPDSHAHIDGVSYLDMLQRTELGLELVEEETRLTRSVFEYAACAVPFVARSRHELATTFSGSVYRDSRYTSASYVHTDSDLVRACQEMLASPSYAARVAAHYHETVVESHGIVRCTDTLLTFAERI